MKMLGNIEYTGLDLLLPPKVMPDEIKASPLPDKHAWIAPPIPFLLLSAPGD